MRVGGGGARARVQARGARRAARGAGAKEILHRSMTAAVRRDLKNYHHRKRGDETGGKHQGEIDHYAATDSLVGATLASDSALGAAFSASRIVNSLASTLLDT